LKKDVEETTSSYLKEKFTARIAKLSRGVGVIKVCHINISVNIFYNGH
jgi:chaperonin GroEL (HSP60 family)